VGGGAVAGRPAAGWDGGEVGSMWGHGVLDKLRGHATFLSECPTFEIFFILPLKK
jgi:hypothetical protein